MALHLIEAYNFMYRCYFGYPKIVREHDSHPIGAIHGCAENFWRLARDEPSHVAVVYDGGGKTARHAIDPTYKQNRSTPPDDLRAQFPYCRDAARAFGFAVIERPGVEADDLIATLARMGSEAGHEVIIHSTDKDFMCLLADPQIVLYDPQKRRTILPSDVQAKFGVLPEQMVDYLSLVGDVADNIPGVDRIGAKTAAALLQAFGTLDQVLASAPSSPAFSTSIRQSLAINGDKARHSKRLVELDANLLLDEDLGALAYSGVDTRRALDFCSTMGLVTLGGEIEERFVEPA